MQGFDDVIAVKKKCNQKNDLISKIYKLLNNLHLTVGFLILFVLKLFVLQFFYFALRKLSLY